MKAVCLVNQLLFFLLRFYGIGIECHFDSLIELSLWRKWAMGYFGEGPVT